MKGEVDFLANFPIDTSLKKKTHSAMSHLFFLFFQGKMQQANNKYGQTLKVPQSTGPPFQEDSSSKRIWNMSKPSRKRPTTTWTQN